MRLRRVSRRIFISCYRQGIPFPRVNRRRFYFFPAFRMRRIFFRRNVQVTSLGPTERRKEDGLLVDEGGGTPKV